MKDYRSKSWQEFRREVIELDGAKCRQCGRPEPDVILQVHHKIYKPGRSAWQYDYRDCETLCKGCHAAEHGKILPKSGWRYLGYEDLGNVSASCELCGSNYRYQFYVYHEDWGSMLVGSLCCNALTGTEIASETLDHQQKYDERRKRFVHSKRWKKISGREIIRQKGIRIEIAESRGNYTIQLNQYPGQKSYDSLEEAKSHVFDILEDGSANEFLNRRGEIHRALPTRKSIRLKNYDYSQAGLYFITICSSQCHCVFGIIEDYSMQLNQLGKTIEREWQQIQELYSNVALHDYVVMPNHFHAIIELDDVTGAMNGAPTIGEIVRGFKARCTRNARLQKQLHKQHLWQRNYYEHIIRDEQSYLQISEYIENNPAKWHEDKYFIPS